MCGANWTHWLIYGVDKICFHGHAHPCPVKPKPRKRWALVLGQISPTDGVKYCFTISNRYHNLFIKNKTSLHHNRPKYRVISYPLITVYQNPFHNTPLRGVIRGIKYPLIALLRGHIHPLTYIVVKGRGINGSALLHWWRGPPLARIREYWSYARSNATAYAQLAISPITVAFSSSALSQKFDSAAALIAYAPQIDTIHIIPR